MKKCISIAVVALLSASCSYMSETNLSDTTLEFKFVEVKGNHALIEIEPDNDYTLYLANVIQADEFDRLMTSMTESQFQKKCMDEVKERYDQWKEVWFGRTDKYLADIYEHEYYTAPNRCLFLRLNPNTRYYVFGFCVNPETSNPLGPIQKSVFTTPEYSPASEGIEFNFMIRDTKDKFFYYVRPSIDGKISFDTYFSTVFKDSDYKSEPYCGDIRAYLKDWIDDMDGVVDYFLSVDISRFETILSLEQGEDYTIVACPYINLGNGPLTLLHFKYEEGMTSTYRYDSVISD